jgi:hypothetical protein
MYLRLLETQRWGWGWDESGVAAKDQHNNTAILYVLGFENDVGDWLPCAVPSRRSPAGSRRMGSRAGIPLLARSKDGIDGMDGLHGIGAQRNTAFQ